MLRAFPALRNRSNLSRRHAPHLAAGAAPHAYCDVRVLLAAPRLALADIARREIVLVPAAHSKQVSDPRKKRSLCAHGQAWHAIMPHNPMHTKTHWPRARRVLAVPRAARRARVVPTEHCRWRLHHVRPGARAQVRSTHVITWRRIAAGDTAPAARIARVARARTMRLPLQLPSLTPQRRARARPAASRQAPQRTIPARRRRT